ncbi:MAG: hypothetical protein EOP24_25970 [Hyphomicrobiales bacterium]|nr:MAG: hypothetical protein EOP24_25970 [Hyphomicrobiales bacterium]
MNFLPDHLQPRLSEVFRTALAQYPWSKALDFSRLRTTDRLVYEALDGEQTFATCLWNLCFPSMSEATLWHYTSLEALRAIVDSREIWLHSLAKRMGEGELSTFARAFGFDGYLQEDQTGRRKIDDLAKDLFFLSLTEKTESGFFQNFGPIRLRLRVSTTQARSELRTIRYAGSDNVSDHPLTLLREIAKQRLNREFVPWQVSRAGAFVLPFLYDDESEVRLLVKRFEGSSDLQIRNSGGFEAIGVPVNRSAERVSISVLDVQAHSPDAVAGANELLHVVPDWNVKCTLA